LIERAEEKDRNEHKRGKKEISKQTKTVEKAKAAPKKEKKQVEVVKREKR
jgi:hypothetical protein